MNDGRPAKPAKQRIPADLEPWFEARRKFRLSHATVQMARELGLNPKNFGKLSNINAAAWKAPLPEFIARCYRRAHKCDQPAEVRTLEQIILDRQAKKAAQKERKAQRRSGDRPGVSPNEA